MKGRKILSIAMTTAALAGTVTVPVRGSPRYDAASNFAIHCMGCHRSDGRGSPPEVPSLVEDLQWMLRSSAGRDYVIRVPGVAGSSLTDGETTAVLNWIIEAIVGRAANTGIAPFTDTEVSAARHRPLLDVRAERSRLLAQSTPASRISSKPAPSGAATHTR